MVHSFRCVFEEVHMIGGEVSRCRICALLRGNSLAEAALMSRSLTINLWSSMSIRNTQED